MPDIVAAIKFVGTVILGAVETVGVIATGAKFGAVGSIIAGVAVLASPAGFKSLIPDMSMPQSDTDKTRQQTVRGTIEPQKVIYGEALVSGPIAFVGVAGTDNNDLYHAVCLAGHECEQIGSVFFDLEEITSAQLNGSGQVTAGVYGPTSDDPSTFITTIEKKLGTSTQAASTLLDSTFSAVTTAHQGKGIAYVVTKWSLTPSSQSVWDARTPRDIKALVKGRIIYDPRLDTSAGANPTTASYQAWSDNPALCAADYLTNTEFGLGVAHSKINYSAVVTAANACDVLVAIPTSATQKRFTCNGVLFATDSHRANINKLLSSMNGTLTYSNGVYTIRAGIFEAATETLTEDDLAGPISIVTSVERGERFNTIRTVFIDPAQNHKSVEAPQVQLTAALSRDNNEVLIRDVQLPMTNNTFMAQRIANKQIQLSDQQTAISFPCNLTGLRVDVGDRVQVTIEELSYSNKIFRCVGWSFSDTQDGVVNLTLSEDDSGSYADPTEAEYSTVSANGVITPGFRGVPDPQNLSATAGLKNIELNWTNPADTSRFNHIVIFAGATSSFSNSQVIGRVNSTQFIHDASNATDPIAPGDQRYYWIRAVSYGAGSGTGVESDRNPDNDISTIQATCGDVTPDFTKIVDDTAAQGAPTNLTLTETTTLGNDGSTLPAIKVSWTAPSTSTYVAFYETLFKNANDFEIDYGSVASSHTATENFGNVADAATLELNFGLVSGAVSGSVTDFSSSNVYGTTTILTGMQELQKYQIKVRAVTRTNKVSDFISGEIQLQGDQTAPGIPANFTATAGIQQIKLNWSNPDDSDYAHTEILENTVNNSAGATLIVETNADQHTVTGLANDTTRYYWLRSVDRSGNRSAFSATAFATTSKVSLQDLSQDVTDAIANASDSAFGIRPVSSLPAGGTYTGELVIRTTDNTIFVWTGTQWTTQVFTASNVDPGSITAASFASGVEPISAVTSLPSPSGYTGPSLVFVTSSKKLFRYDSTVPEFTAAIDTSDLAGTLGSSQFANDLRPVEVVSTLPTTGNFEGRVAVLTTDDKLYRYTGNEWTKAISAEDLSDQVDLATQVFGQVQASNLTAGQVEADAIASNAVIAAKIQAGAVSTAKLAADAVTAAKIDVSELFADSAVIGAIQASSITTAAVVSAIGSFEFISADNIVAGAITGAKLSVNTIEANKIKLDGLTLDADGDNLVIKTGGVGTSQIASNAVTQVAQDPNNGTQTFPGNSSFRIFNAIAQITFISTGATVQLGGKFMARSHNDQCLCQFRIKRGSTILFTSATFSVRPNPEGIHVPIGFVDTGAGSGSVTYTLEAGMNDDFQNYIDAFLFGLETKR